MLIVGVQSAKVSSILKYLMSDFSSNSFRCGKTNTEGPQDLEPHPGLCARSFFFNGEGCGVGTYL